MPAWDPIRCLVCGEPDSAERRVKRVTNVLGRTVNAHPACAEDMDRDAYEEAG